MKKTFMLAALCSAITVNSYAQSEEFEYNAISHEISVQANELLRQTINLSNNTTPVDNNYFVKYGIRSEISNWGANIGFGYLYTKDTDKDGRENIANDLFYRVGAGRRISLSKRLEASWSLDFVGSSQKNNTVILEVNPFEPRESELSTTDTKISAIGGGPHVELSFAITKHFLIGTEASYYYLSTKNKQNTTIVLTDLDSQGNESVTITSENKDSKIETIQFTAPVAIFIIIKF